MPVHVSVDGLLYNADLFKRALAQNNLSEASFVAGQQQAILRAAITDAASGVDLAS